MKKVSKKKTLFITTVIISLLLIKLEIISVSSPTIQKFNSENNTLILVNKSTTLPSNYKPNNLVEVKVPLASNITSNEKKMTSEAAEALAKMFNKGKKDGMNFYAVSGYRSYEMQKTLYKENTMRAGKEQTDKYVAFPGASEHQTGLAMDVTNEAGIDGALVDDFSQTPEGIWLKENCKEFGFIIRYPKNKEELTGYNYEPWHIRYVGISIAKEITSKNLVLEEYLESKS